MTKQSRAIYVRLYWVQDRVRQGQFSYTIIFLTRTMKLLAVVTPPYIYRFLPAGDLVQFIHAADWDSGRMRKAARREMGCGMDQDKGGKIDK